MSTQLDSDHAVLDCPVAWPRPGEGRGLGGAPTFDEELGAWVVSRYRDVDRVVRDAPTFSSQAVMGPDRAASFKPLLENLAGDPRAATAAVFFHVPMIASDGPAHTRERSFVKKAFTPKRVAAMSEAIQALCDELVDAMVGRTVAFVREFAVPLPARTIATMLGIPPEDYRDFKRWSDGLMSLIGSPNPTPEQLEVFISSAVEFTDYITPMIEERRGRPGDDIISAIAGENDAGERLTDDEILATCSALLIAGNETTTSSLAGTLLYLVRTPGLQERVRADLALVPALVEEGLRLSCPIQALFRTATTDAEVGGAQIAEGEHLYLRYAAANRDADQFADPLVPHADRPDKRHLSFGRGIHVCPGAPLAREEMQIALDTLLRRSCAIALADRDEPVAAVGNHMTAAIGELYLDVRA